MAARFLPLIDQDRHASTHAFKTSNSHGTFSRRQESLIENETKFPEKIQFQVKVRTRSHS